MNEALQSYFRCPESAFDFRLGEELQKEPGFFRFGEHVNCYGQSCVRQPATNCRAQLEDVCLVCLKVQIDRRHVTLPFDPD